ncbi:MAG: hypothetical protein COB36_08710 [Alphaproteobacteria bacterium]|nr:MAG: hypothetical protein COB36_08710 [Alphaproteobacteria bacterium]
MLLSSEFNKEKFLAGSYFVSSNSEILVSEIDDFLQDDWDDVLHAVAQENKAVALVDVVRDEYYTFEDHMKDNPDSKMKESKFISEQIGPYYRLLGMVTPTQFSEDFVEKFESVEDLKIKYVSAKDFRKNADAQLQGISETGFIDVHDLEKHIRVSIVSPILCSDMVIDKEGCPSLRPEPKYPTDIEKLSF